MSRIDLPEIAKAVTAILAAVNAGAVQIQHAREFFAKEGITDADLRAIDADYDRRIAEAEQRASGESPAS
ncbi:MAG: hypothetical protein AB7O67_16470 [Vicinamibacterales bacterium]